MNLMGSEDVYRAGTNISSAADTISSAAGSFESTSENLKMILDDFLIRFQEIVERINHEKS